MSLLKELTETFDDHEFEPQHSADNAGPAHKFTVTMNNTQLDDNAKQLIQAKLEKYANSLINMVPGTSASVQYHDE